MDIRIINFWFGLVIFIGLWSLVLFLVDFANRTGKWWFYLIALFVFISTVVGTIVEIRKQIKKEKKNANTT